MIPGEQRFEEDLRDQAAAIEEARNEIQGNPPEAIDEVDALEIDDRLKGMLISSVAIATASGTDASTVFQQEISKSGVKFEEYDLIAAAGYLGIEDVPAWFEELASWL